MQLSRCLNGAPFVNVPAVLASDSAVIFPDTLDQALGWNADGTVQYIEVVVAATPGSSYTGGTYRQTFTYSGGLVTSISRWVKQ